MFHWWGGPLLIAINTVPWAMLAWLLAQTGLPAATFVMSFAVTFALYYLAYEGLHLLMHKPQLPWLENLRFFRFIKEYHRIHHVQMGKNLNVVLPIADVLFGTFVWKQAESAPRITPESAKRTARLNSRYAQHHPITAKTP